MNAEKHCTATITAIGGTTTTTMASTTTTTCREVSLKNDDGTTENTFTNGPTDCGRAYVTKSFTLSDSYFIDEIELSIICKRKY